MECSLCTESPDDPKQLISTCSEEGLRLNVQKIIKKHLGLELDFPGVESNTKNGICRSCCKILCDFHELYLKVERKQKWTTQDILDHTDSDGPLSEQRNELKVEFSEIKLEPQTVNLAVESDLEITTKRRSNRIVARRANLSESQPELEYKSLIDIDVNIISEESLLEELHADGLEVSNHGSEPFVEAESGDNDHAVVNVMDDNQSNIKRLDKALSQNKIKKPFDGWLAENFKFSCCLCPEAFSDFKALKTHFRTKHKTDGYVLCCGKKFHKRCFLVDHIRKHINPDIYKCQTCDKVYSSSNTLKKHSRLHNPERRSFQCEICQKSYVRKCDLSRHMQIHTAVNKKLQFENKSLNDIGINIRSGETLLKVLHVDDINGKINLDSGPFVEVASNEVEKSVDAMVNEEPLLKVMHVNEGSNYDVEPFVEVATNKVEKSVDKTISEETLLEVMHVNEVSNYDIEPFVKAAANETSQAVDNMVDDYKLNIKTRKKKVKNIKRLVHNIKLVSSSPLMQSLCKSSSRSQVLKSYDDFLAENYEFSCCLCHVALSDFNALKTHFRFHHHTDGFERCCGKKFYKRSILIDHIRSHIDPEFYKCPTCGKVFSNRTYLRKHLRHLRHNFSSKCEICQNSNRKCDLSKLCK